MASNISDGLWSMYSSYGEARNILWFDLGRNWSLEVWFKWIPEGDFTVYSLAGIEFVGWFSTVIHSNKFWNDMGALDCLLRDKKRLNWESLEENWGWKETKRATVGRTEGTCKGLAGLARKKGLDLRWEGLEGLAGRLELAQECSRTAWARPPSKLR